MAEHTSTDNILFPAQWRSYFAILIAAGFACILVSLGLCSLVGDQGLKTFFHSYLANYIFCLSMCLGALFFVLVQHLVRASWSATIRRVGELLATTIPWWAILFLPILISAIRPHSDVLYPWNAVELEPLVQQKIGYLNGSFFTIRALIYFGVWIFAGMFCFTLSRQQDHTGSAEITLKLQKWSGPLIVLFALALNFAAFDWVMSTDPAWYSTIFGVYLFAASMMAFFAASIVVFNILQRNGRVIKYVSTEHYHDMGKFLFGFVFFWSYIAFSQYMLYWYGNIPEETLWFKHRMVGGWGYVGILLILGHFAIPMLGLLSRHVRRHRNALFGWAIFLLVMHWVDMSFLVLPNVGPFSLAMLLGHFTCLVGLLCIFLALFMWRVGDTPLVATRDPWIQESLAYHNM